MASQHALPDGLTRLSFFDDDDFEIDTNGESTLVLTNQACSTLLGCQESLPHVHYLGHEHDNPQPIYSLLAHTYSGGITLSGHVLNLSSNGPPSIRPTNATVQQSNPISIHSDAFTGTFDSLSHQRAGYNAFNGATQPSLWEFGPGEYQDHGLVRMGTHERPITITNPQQPNGHLEAMHFLATSVTEGVPYSLGFMGWRNEELENSMTRLEPGEIHYENTENQILVAVLPINWEDEGGLEDVPLTNGYWSSSPTQAEDESSTQVEDEN
ncbi:hypothetical protein TREMEDRAFT_63735 [Tremella mesenterica DSM 1558]|uniref:uncharacterized protein n=1 Tax=Tremella mesenterica (strain ATCC 24925 / CBS 8224 / DSM 1558 / NBRC 9311 / NRRL Y-6157 / RJB 2259-6 / UBC 559-6) TaxID=578456 RepID=UPI0003F49EEF|nr:uncharacterized protein TREMEDRAFT_63735 [Tremella mesenterica DSM 1558]EIW67844.1 hypothetical protein TREMEDRAFT_63735 [Tremella mesenterica DSM 1558]